jgi:hypothetical protein
VLSKDFDIDQGKIPVDSVQSASEKRSDLVCKSKGSAVSERERGRKRERERGRKRLQCLLLANVQIGRESHHIRSTACAARENNEREGESEKVVSRRVAEVRRSCAVLGSKE